MYPFLFWVEYWNELDECMDKASGCTFAPTFTKAMENIEDWYGKDLCGLRLECLEENSILEFASYEEGEKISHESY